MKNIQNIAIIGGGGRTGRFLVEALLRQGYLLQLLLRHPEQFSIQNPAITTIQGDVLDPQAVNAVVAGCDAVISVVGQRKDEPLVASQATINILHAIRSQPAGNDIRYIALAGLNVDTPSDRKGPETQQATSWMRETFPDIHADRQKSYAILEESDVKWVLVRVPFIEFIPAKHNLQISLIDCPGTKVTAGDIAEFMIGLLDGDQYWRKAPFVANG
ncbi:NAD(P)-dependent oxidoreductase [Dyadobacter sandarakinus]|uniref:SDR family oxidoreductase n=1 Tax=Dyadobacter sandarakinus TaxID=2747268 RepID=A0ABX7I856_9BACT|nr:NAD(P)-binding oxidoreductase [Dyadobacter sandarakinus]QRR02033.1 SDR family oxidoreductase [Dyadobacter sandarakinus]